jgi:hypothetical protein
MDVEAAGLASDVLQAYDLPGIVEPTIAGGFEDDEDGILDKNSSSVADRTIDSDRSLLIVPDGSSVEAVELAFDVLQADSLPGIVESSIAGGLEDDEDGILEKKASSFANRTIGTIPDLRSSSIVPDGNSVKAAELACDVLQADSLPGIIVSKTEEGLEPDEDGFIEKKPPNEEENEEEGGYEHDHKHKAHVHGATHGFEETQAHDAEPGWHVDTVGPDADVFPLLPAEVQVNPETVHVAVHMVYLSIHWLSGELLLEFCIPAADIITILDLKHIVGREVGVDPLMIELLQQHTQEPLRNGQIVVIFPENDRLLFTAIVTRTKAFVRDQLLLQGDCVADDASWPSLEVLSDLGSDWNGDMRDEDFS